jgi:hypothetical protein
MQSYTLGGKIYKSKSAVLNRARQLWTKLDQRAKLVVVSKKANLSILRRG